MKLDYNNFYSDRQNINEKHDGGNDNDYDNEDYNDDEENLDKDEINHENNYNNYDTEKKSEIDEYKPYSKPLRVKQEFNDDEESKEIDRNEIYENSNYNNNIIDDYQLDKDSSVRYNKNEENNLYDRNINNNNLENNNFGDLQNETSFSKKFQKSDDKKK